MADKVVRDPCGSGSRASTEPCGLGPSGFDPSRPVAITLTPRMLEDLALGASLVRISEGWGHGPGGGPGERMAGFYYLNERARAEEVFPAHCMGGIRDLILTLDRSVRDSDGSPEGEKPQALSAQHDSAGPQDIAPQDPLPTPNAGDAR